MSFWINKIMLAPTNQQQNKILRSTTKTIVYFIIEVLFFIYFLFELFIYAPSKLRGEEPGLSVEVFIIWLVILLITFRVYVDYVKQENKKSISDSVTIAGTWTYIITGVVLFIRLVDLLTSNFGLYLPQPLTPSFNAAIILFNFFLVPALFYRIIFEFRLIIKSIRKK